MNVYDAVIAGVNRCLAPYTPRVWPADPGRAAREGGKNQLILGSEAAYELGALSCDSVSCLLLTEDEGQVPRDEIVLYGPDLPEIKEDCSFARITVLRTEDITKDGEQVKVWVSVKYLDQRTKATQISQFDLTLHKDSNWKIVG